MNKELKFLQYGKISLGTTLKEKGAGVLMGKFFSLVYCGFFFSVLLSYATELTREKETHLTQVLSEYGLIPAYFLIASMNPLFISV